MKNKLVSESLLEDDLKWLVNETVYVDMHKTKLGDDKDHIVLGILINDKNPAHDLAKFIENGVNQFEDVEVSPATDAEGRYLVYIEIARDAEAFESINGILNDTSKLCGIESWRFVTMHSAELDFNQENFTAHIVTDPAEYQRLHAKDSDKDESSQMEESIRQRLDFLLKY